jgi:hypothetical protein
MQVEVVVPLIVLGFLLPLVLYLVYRRYQRLQARALLTKGELFDRDPEKFDVIEEGKTIEVPWPKGPTKTLEQAVRKLATEMAEVA